MVGVDVDRSGANDAIGLNFEDALHVADVEVFVAGFPVPGLDGPFRNFLEGIGRLDLLPIPVDRASTSPTTMVAADGRVIDDTSADDRDAFAALVTLGGGSAGDRSAFTRHFISDGGNAGDRRRLPVAVPHDQPAHRRGARAWAARSRTATSPAPYASTRRRTST